MKINDQVFLEVLVAKFADEGFAIARGLFSTEECDRYSNYFTSMVERGGDGWAETVVDPDHADPLRRYPRLLQPHRGDDVAMEYMLEPRINAHLTAFCGGEPYAVQTMVYFKPAGARGQALHQDNMYLKVQPGTCVAAWLALDDCTEESGCMAVVPGSKSLPIMCQKETLGLDEICWGTTETPIPPGLTPELVLMSRGDVLFFGGGLIHGSYQNRTTDQFRRTLIGHYIMAESTQVAKYYFPVFRMDGSQLDDGISVAAQDGGPCGVYVEKAGHTEIVMAGSYQEYRAAH